MELDLHQFFRDLLKKHENDDDKEVLVEKLVQHANDFRDMP